jgi:hypothetical protein
MCEWWALVLPVIALLGWLVGNVAIITGILLLVWVADPQIGRREQ